MSSVSSGADLVSPFIGAAVPLGVSVVAYETLVILKIASVGVMRGMCSVLMRSCVCMGKVVND